MDGLDRYEDGCLRPIQAVEEDNRITPSSLRTSTGQMFQIHGNDLNTNTDFTLVDSTSEGTQTSYSTQPNIIYMYLEYESQALRKDTFITPHRGNVIWPHDDSVMDIDLLVNCGFFYTGRHDLVRCFQCGIGLKDWAKGDNPVSEHIRRSPNCAFATKTRDNNLLWKYQKHIAEAKGYSDVCRCFSCDGGLRDWEPDSDPWLEHAKKYPNCQFVLRKKEDDYVYKIQSSDYHQTYRKQIDTSGGSSTRRNVDVSKTVRQAIELGFPKSEVDRAVEICQTKGISTDVDHVINILLDNQERVDTTKRQKTDVQMLTKKKHSKHNETEDTASCIDVDEIGQENGALKIDRLCKICMDDQVNILFLPCGHLVVCYKCGETMTECPECKKAIKGKARIFLS